MSGVDVLAWFVVGTPVAVVLGLWVWAAVDAWMNDERFDAVVLLFVLVWGIAALVLVAAT